MSFAAAKPTKAKRKKQKSKSTAAPSPSSLSSSAASSLPSAARTATRLNLHLDLGQAWWELKSGGSEGDVYLQQLLDRRDAAAASAAAEAEADLAVEGDVSLATSKKKKNKKQKQKKEQQHATAAAAAAAAAAVPASESMRFEEVEALRRAAGELYVTQVKFFHKKSSGDSDSAWLKTMMRKGTISDRVAAMTLAIQQDPVYNEGVLAQLTGMAAKNNQREQQLAMESLKDLYINNLLPDRPLLFFGDHPAEALRAASDKRRVLWHFEHELKTHHATLVGSLVRGTSDNLEHFKKFCMNTIAELLSSKPEGEAVLLTALVNKLGDPKRSIASKAGFLLTQLTQSHPNMKEVIVVEVVQMMHRSNISEKSQYYGIVFLNQLQLRRAHAADQALARRLVKVYFDFFEQVIAQRKLVTRMLSALLTGVNRAFPYADLSPEMVDKQVDTLFRVVHQATFKTSVQALLLLLQCLSIGESGFVDRFYSAVYSKLLDPELLRASKPALFLNLVYRTMKQDKHRGRVMAFAKRVLQAAFHGSASMAAGMVYLLSAVFKIRPQLLQDMQGSADAAGASEAGDDGASGAEPARSVAKAQVAADGYDILARNPKFASTAGAKGKSGFAPPMWELGVMAHHFHPSVRKFAEQLGAHEPIVYDGDPFQDFTTMAFLDRFSYKKPKQRDLDGTGPQRGISAMQPRGRGSASSSVYTDDAVNSEAFVGRSARAVRPEEQFFLRYFREKLARDGAERQAAAEERRATGLSGDVPGADTDAFEDEEAFANDIAEKFMADHARSTGQGIDPDDDPDFFSDDGSKGGSGSDSDGDDGPNMSMLMGGADDDTDDDDDDDDNDDDDDDNDDDDTEGPASVGRRKKQQASAFASAEEFAAMLEQSGVDDVSARQVQWEDRQTGGRGRRRPGGAGAAKKKRSRR